jgi:putative chitinase
MPIDVVDVLNRAMPMMPRALSNYTQAIRQGAELFEKAGITTPLRMAHFLAQTLFETGRFTVLRENMDYSSAQRIFDIFGVNHHSAAVTLEQADNLVHRPEELAERVYGLGNPHKAQEFDNTRPGDGFRYRGNGVLQMTGRLAHRKMGQACGVDFEGNPDLATAPEHALKPALQEWTDDGLNAFADKNDIATITRRINGGFNGLPERKLMFDKAFSLLQPGADPVAAGEPDDDVRSLQRNLNTLGADPQLEVDGRFGKQTRLAVKEFQTTAGIQADGIPGPVTMANIQLTLASIRRG